MRVIRTLAVMVAFLGFSVGVSAQGMHGGMQGQQGKAGQMGGHGGMMGMMQQMHGDGMMMHGGQGMMGSSLPSVKTILGQAKVLDLSDEQIHTLKKQALDLKKEIIQLKANAQIAGVDLARTLKNENPDQKDVEKAVENQHSKKLNLQKAQLDSYFAGLDVLTADQRDQVSALGGGCMMMQGVHGGKANGGHMGGMMQPGDGDME